MLTRFSAWTISQGKYDEAESLYEQAIRVSEKAHGPEHPLVTKLLNNYAMLLKKQVKQDFI